jgi:putative ATPase
LSPLSDVQLVELIHRAVEDQRGLRARITVDEEVAAQIAMLSGGDARKALTILEAGAQALLSEDGGETAKLTLEMVENSIDRALVRYDANGDQHYDVISAFIKSVRGSDADAAIHYLARMVEAGEDPRFIARRLIILAAEDIGLADPSALTLAVSAAEAVAMIGMPEGRIPLAEATIYLSLAPKSNSAYSAIKKAVTDVRAGFAGQIPNALRSSNYAGARQASGAGVGYRYPHDDKRSVVEQAYLDGKVANSVYYEPKDLGIEKELGERWSKLRAIIRAFRK